MITRIDVTQSPLADRVVEIQRAAYAVEAELMRFDGIPQLHENAPAVRERVDLRWLGAFVADSLAGVIAWEPIDGGVDIDRLAVDPASARRGLGRRLVRSVLSTGTTTVSTGAANLPARTLYESLGFRLVSTREIAPGVEVVDLKRSGQ